MMDFSLYLRTHKVIAVYLVFPECVDRAVCRLFLSQLSQTLQSDGVDLFSITAARTEFPPVMQIVGLCECACVKR